jgi:hypothetical protein
LGQLEQFLGFMKIAHVPSLCSQDVFAYVGKTYQQLKQRPACIRCSEKWILREDLKDTTCRGVHIYHHPAHGNISATTGIREEHDFSLGSDIQSYVIGFSFGRGSVVPRMS